MSTAVAVYTGLIICPVPACAAPLVPDGTGRTWRCPAGHAFDAAHAGYLNLLLARGRNGATRGDSRAMVQARQRFLARGFYAPLIAATARVAVATTADRPAPVLLDAGCGPGVYLGAAVAALNDRRPGSRPVCAVGTDISREAARAAARVPGVLALVADTTRRLPIADSRVDLLLNIFAPRASAEFARVIAPGGRLLVVLPRPEHLVEARHMLPMLGQEAEKEAAVVVRLAAGFTAEERSVVRANVVLDRDALSDLLRMTPSAFHLDEAGMAAAVAGVPLPFAVTAAFTLLTFRRR